ncbi:MAG: lipocalin family protein [Prevotellaceae bacterium]|jgi:hypothetical protein|nr:lipocalin family protein [Prevotellaceae bacterium]
MKRLLFFITFSFILNFVYSQDLTGTWNIDSIKVNGVDAIANYKDYVLQGVFQQIEFVDGENCTLYVDNVKKNGSYIIVNNEITIKTDNEYTYQIDLNQSLLLRANLSGTDFAGMPVPYEVQMWFNKENK